MRRRRQKRIATWSYHYCWPRYTYAGNLVKGRATAPLVHIDGNLCAKRLCEHQNVAFLGAGGPCMGESRARPILVV